MDKLVFLYNSADLVKVRMIYAMAAEDQARLGLQPWLDKPAVSQRDVPTLGAGEDVDPQIERVIAEAAAVLYFVGDIGAGSYQRTKEAEATLKAVEARANGDRPLLFLPVLLEGGELANLPDWIRRRFILNIDGLLRTPAQIWAAILQRLQARDEPVAADLPSAEPRVMDADERIARRVRKAINKDRPALTIFIGPYAYARGCDTIGPAMMTEQLLSEINISAATLLPILPWPSEAAQWASLAKGPVVVTDLFRSQLSAAGQTPPALAKNIGELAARWTDWQETLPRRRVDWSGLLLLTTRVDLALESALARITQVPFTRILPTLNGSEGITSADRRQLVQHWHPKRTWDPRSGVPPAIDAAADVEKQLKDFGLDEASPVILVKLCGSLDVEASLILTAYDFFEKATDLESLPKVVKEVIRTSPQLLLGRGFASPLAQLVRAFVLGRRQQRQERIWVMPSALESEREDDVLCQLELTLLAEDEKGFLNALEANVLHRGEQDIFVRRLAELI